MYSKVAPIGAFAPYRYVVILSRYRGKLLLSRHRDRTTWETQGGHVEPGETPEMAAHRELWEESGALRYTLHEAFDYEAGDAHGSATGRVFFADTEELGPILESEMAETAVFDAPPQNITYPGILPVLWVQPAAKDFFGRE